MTKLFTTLALVVLGITASAQQSLPMITLAGDTSFSIMENQIWKVDNITGDSTSKVNYMDWRGDTKEFVSDTNEAEIITRTDWIFTPTGLGYSISALRVVQVVPANPATDSTCVFFYRGKNNSIEKIGLNISIGQFNALINAL